MPAGRTRSCARGAGPIVHGLTTFCISRGSCYCSRPRNPEAEVRTRMATPSQASPTDVHGSWDTSYEVKIILVLSLAFGLVGLDRFILPVLFPSMMGEL